MSGKREKKIRKLERQVEVLEHRVAVCEAWTPETRRTSPPRRGFRARLAAWLGK